MSSSSKRYSLSITLLSDEISSLLKLIENKEFNIEVSCASPLSPENLSIFWFASVLIFIVIAYIFGKNANIMPFIKRKFLW